MGRGRAVLHPEFYDDESDAPRDEHVAHQGGLEEGLDQFVKKKPDGARGQEGPAKLLEQFRACKELLTVHLDDGEHRPKLDDHLEYLMRLGLRQLQKRRSKDEMTG